jgi:hypothetical protein
LLVGALLGESAETLKQRLANVAIRRSISKALHRVAISEDALPPTERQKLAEAVSSPDFIAIVCGDELSSQKRHELETRIEGVLQGLRQPAQALLLIKLRDAATASVEASLPLADRVLHRSIRRLNEQVANLSATIGDVLKHPSALAREVTTHLDALENQGVKPQLPGIDAIRDDRSAAVGSPYVSALALAVADVLERFPVEDIARGVVEPSLLIDTYLAVDRLLTRFEAQSVTILRLLDRAGFTKAYYGSSEIGPRAVMEVNLRLVRISEQMRQIAGGIQRISALHESFRQRLVILADICIQIVEVEDFLVLRLLPRRTTGAPYEDNLLAPSFPGELGQHIIDDYSRNLVKLLRYRSALQSNIAHLLHALPKRRQS